MNQQKRIAVLVFIIVILIPFALFLFWSTKPRPTVDPLPIVGQRQLEERVDSNGQTVYDTIYHTLIDFNLVNQDGDSVDLTIMDDKVVIADFFFTSCKGICIPMTQNMAKLQEEFLEEDNVFLLSHTVDPARDTVETLKEHAYLYDLNPKRWFMLTGDKKELYRLARKGYMITADEGDGGEHDFIHSERFVLIDKEKRIRGYYDGTDDEEMERLSLDVKKLLVSYVIPPPKKKKK